MKRVSVDLHSRLPRIYPNEIVAGPEFCLVLLLCKIIQLLPLFFEFLFDFCTFKYLVSYLKQAHTL